VKNQRIEGVLKTIEPKDLETCTSRGWVLVKMFQDKTVKSIPEIVDAPGFDSYEGYHDADGIFRSLPRGKAVIYRQVPVLVTFFVVQKDKESALAKIQEKLTQSESSLADAAIESSKKIASVLAESKKEMDLLKEKLNESENKLKNQVGSEAIKLLTLKIKDLEKDLATARSEAEEARQQLAIERQTQFGVRRLELTENAT